MIEPNIKAIGGPITAQAIAIKNSPENRFTINIETQNIKPKKNRVPSITS